MTSKIHLWLPSFASGKGGIQVFSDYLLQALEEIPNIEISVLIKNDTRAELATLPPRAKPTHFGTCGDLNGSVRTMSFSAKAFSMALREKPALILTAHANFAPLALWIHRALKIPYWTVCHGIEVWGFQPTSKWKALRQSQRLLCVSNYTLNQVAQVLARAKGEAQSTKPLGSPTSDFCHLSSGVWFPNTIQTEHFAIHPKPEYLLKRYGLEPTTPVIFTLARMSASEAYKGYDVLIRALPQIRKVFPGVRYIIGGKGDDRPRIETLIRELGLEGNVTLAGFLPDHEVTDHYNLCDLFAMPSKGEGFGIVFLEAMACGKPVLAGNKDGSVDAVNGGELGALVDPDNVEAVAQTSTEILQRRYPNPLMYQPEALRQRVDEIYGFAQFQKRLMSLLNDFK